MPKQKHSLLKTLQNLIILQKGLRFFSLLIILFLSTKPIYSQIQAASNKPVNLGNTIALDVLYSPVPFNAQGRTHLVYELHITNFRPSDLTLARVEVLSGDAQAPPLASLADEELITAIWRPGTRTADVPDKRIIGGGKRMILHLWVTVDEKVVPNKLRHYLIFKINRADGTSTDGKVEAGEISVRNEKPIVISPPLNGNGWVAGYGPANNSMHRFGLFVVNGKVGNAQRFAIDWMKLGEDGKFARGDYQKNENWYGYGAEVLSVSNGIVMDVKDGIPENVPLSDETAVPITAENAAGNSVLVKFGNRLVMYAHLQPGSIRVKPGDRVRRGKVLGKLGNSGNSDAPHLHFHISDAPQFLNVKEPIPAEGLPFVFGSFTLLGKTKSTEELEKGGKWIPPANEKPSRRKLEMPLGNAVINFD